jgi:predicted site-specific integrase-resolvase
MLTMNSKTRNDLDRQIKELNERTKGGYAVGYAYGKCVLETKDGFNTFGFDRMTKTQLYNALYMLNKVLANEEYRDKKEIEA